MSKRLVLIYPIL